MRLFIAVDLPSDIENYFLDLQNKLDNVRLTKSFHLTLLFLGNIDNLNKIVSNLENIKCDPFKLTTTQIGAFPNKNYIKVIWVGLEEEEKLNRLVDEIDSILNIKREHKFHPHITLARVNKKINFPEIKLHSFTFPVTCFVLYQSILTREGPIYKKIKKFKLK